MSTRTIEKLDAHRHLVLVHDAMNGHDYLAGCDCPQGEFVGQVLHQFKVNVLPRWTQRRKAMATKQKETKVSRGYWLAVERRKNEQLARLGVELAELVNGNATLLSNFEGVYIGQTDGVELDVVGPLVSKAREILKAKEAV